MRSAGHQRDDTRRKLALWNASGQRIGVLGHDHPSREQIDAIAREAIQRKELSAQRRTGRDVSDFHLECVLSWQAQNSDTSRWVRDFA